MWGAVGIADRPVRMLLTACTALGLLERDGERFANAPLADEFLVSHRPRYFGDFVLLLDEEQYRPWADLDVSLREDRPVAWGAQAEKRLPADRAEAEPRFWKGISSVAASTAAAVAAAFDFSPFRALLDVGGGQGDFSVELCRRHATLRATVYDLPSVCRVGLPKGLRRRTRAPGRDVPGMC